jgi:serine protease Do
MNEFENQEHITDDKKKTIKKEKGFGTRLAGVAAKTITFGLVAGFIAGSSVSFGRYYIADKLSAISNEPQLSATSISDTIVDSDTDSQGQGQSDATGTSLQTVSVDEASANTIEIIKKVKPSIVCITSVSQSRNIFNQSYQSEGSGSGIMFYKDDDNVYIATNNHVIDGASTVSIAINDSDDLIPATLVGKDSNADLAVISVSNSDILAAGIDNVQLATFGDSDELQMGESVIAIGNALGQGNTATAGIVSALQKDVTIQGRKLSVIQTDAAINPGNSGGALVNSKGQVIGINTAKIALDSVEGIGYSITSNVAKPIIEQLMNSTDTPTLGVYITTVTEDLASQYNLPTAGVLIQQVIEGGSAEKADLRAGDVVTAYNDTPVFNSDQLIQAVKASKVGDTATLTIVRDGNTKTIDIVLEKGNSSF